MKVFFQHFPMELSEKTALKVMYKVMCDVVKKEDDYIEKLEKLKDMIELFLQEKGAE